MAKIEQIKQQNPELIEELIARASRGESISQISVGINKPRQWVSGMIQELGIDYTVKNSRPLKRSHSTPKKTPEFLRHAKAMDLSFVSSDVVSVILKKVCDCSPLSVACMAAGVSQYDLQEWKDRAANREPEYADLMTLIAKAQAFAMEKLEAQLQSGGPGWQGAQVMLKALAPEIYDPKSCKESQRAQAASALRDVPTSVLDSILESRYCGKSVPSDTCANLKEFSSDFGNLNTLDDLKESVK